MMIAPRNARDIPQTAGAHHHLRTQTHFNSSLRPSLCLCLCLCSVHCLNLCRWLCVCTACGSHYHALRPRPCHSLSLSCLPQSLASPSPALVCCSPSAPPTALLHCLSPRAGAHTRAPRRHTHWRVSPQGERTHLLSLICISLLPPPPPPHLDHTLLKAADEHACRNSARGGWARGAYRRVGEAETDRVTGRHTREKQTERNRRRERERARASHLASRLPKRRTSSRRTKGLASPSVLRAPVCREDNAGRCGAGGWGVKTEAGGKGERTRAREPRI